MLSKTPNIHQAPFGSGAPPSPSSLPSLSAPFPTPAATAEAAETQQQEDEEEEAAEGGSAGEERS